MAFDRKDYGMNSGIPFIKIADPVDGGSGQSNDILFNLSPISTIQRN